MKLDNSNVDTILVTGSSGYLGAILVRELGREFRIVGVDVTPNSSTTHVVMDLRDRSEYKNLEKYQFSYVIHTAWDQLTSNIYENNVQLSENLLNFLLGCNLNGLIFLSSSLASIPTYIQYTRSKLAVENLIVDYGVPYAILRPDMLYSSDEPKLLEQLNYMRKRFAICVGTGKSLRSPTHIRDVCLVIRQMLQSDRFLNRVYEIGSPTPCTQLEFIHTLSSAYNLDPHIIHVPKIIAECMFRLTRKLDPEQARTIEYHRIADLTALIEDFAFTPRLFDVSSVLVPASGSGQ
jgi:nucleoside-diphosphate-sugar epimerase